MKPQNIFLQLTMLFFVMALTSCAQPAEDVQPSFTATPAPQPSVTSPTPVVTDTPITLPTSTIVPTLPADDADRRLLNLLANNNNCRLPCLWGITPGKSTHDDADMVLLPLSAISDFTSLNTSPGDISPIYIDGSDLLYTRMAFLFPENGIINHIVFQTRIMKKVITPNGEPGLLEIFEITPLSKNLEFYMLPNILSQLGIPTSVVVSISATPANIDVYGGFDIVLLYPDQGVFVHYTTQRKLFGEVAQGCFNNSSVELELFPAGDRELFSEGLDTTVWANMWPEPVDTPRWKTIETATSMSVEEFYEAFQKPTNKCLETPMSLWPTQEP